LAVGEVSVEDGAMRVLATVYIVSVSIRRVGVRSGAIMDLGPSAMLTEHRYFRCRP